MGISEHVVLRTCDFVDDEAAQPGVGDEQQGRDPFCVAWVGGYVEGLCEERHGVGICCGGDGGLHMSCHIGKARSRVVGFQDVKPGTVSGTDGSDDA